jgi:hypothetical protein
MSTPQQGADPAMERWIAEQMQYFKPSDMDAAVRLLRSYDRADRELAARKANAA